MRSTEVGRELLRLFLPRACLGCGERVAPEEGEALVCGRCKTLLRSPPSPWCPRCQMTLGTGHPQGESCLECQGWPEILVSSRSAVVLEPPADALVHALKYQGWRGLGALMARRMARNRPATREAPLLVPVPTTLRRRRFRGYNQAEILALDLSRLLDRPFLKALRRPGGASQVRLTPRERARNVREAFQPVVETSSRIRGRSVILVDDVLTTGATARSAAGVLGELGAGEVHVLTFARAMPYSEKSRRLPDLR